MDEIVGELPDPDVKVMVGEEVTIEEGEDMAVSVRRDERNCPREQVITSVAFDASFVCMEVAGGGGGLLRYVCMQVAGGGLLRYVWYVANKASLTVSTCGLWLLH